MDSKIVNEEDAQKYGKNNEEDEKESAGANTDKILEEEFICSCCFEILLDPTTLTCGHTFCRFCLANWWNMSQKAECLQCRRPFSDFPNVNFTLRNTLERLYGEKVNEKRASVESQGNYANVLDAFERHVDSDRNHANERRNANHFNCGTLCIILSFIVGVIILIAIGMRTLFGGPDVLLENKIITEWSPEDVAYWVGEQGAWAKGIYDKRFQEAGIDGHLLLRMKEEDLAGPPISMFLGLHRRVLVDALEKLKSRKKDSPGDFWEFKAANRAKSLFLLFGLRQFPRTMILYLYFFDYNELFLPYLHQICKVDNSDMFNSTNVTGQGKQPTLVQWRSFIFWTLTFPYYMIGYYASHFLVVNYWISRIVIFHALAMGLLEITNARGFFRPGGLKLLPGMMLKNFIWVLGCSLLLKILWPFVPFFICDMIFSWMFFISPFDALNRLFRRINNNRNAPNRNRNRDGAANWQFDFHFHRD